ncbi:PilN family type IVB pilus formation outer membrane protein [Cronobacter sakazakii]|nr:PilN family type IVB pilus formation outer membrane protein [Cronobacter sakazakii]
MNKKKIAALVAVSIALSGCGVKRINDNMKSASQDMADVTKKLDDSFSSRPTVRFHNEQWINPKPVKIAVSAIPQKVVNCNITYKPGKAIDIYQFGQDVSTLCGIPVRVSPDAAMLVSGGGVSEGQTRQTDSVPPPIPTPDANGMIPLQGFNATAPKSQPMNTGSAGTISNIAYTGNVAGLLDSVTSRLGVSWKYEDNKIFIYYLETKQFRIDTSDAKNKLYSSIKSGISSQAGTSSSGTGSTSSGGVSGDSGTTSNAELQMSNDIYGDLKSTAESMLTPGVGRLSMNNTSGTIVVTDVPEVVRSIGEYITSENASLSKQISLSVKIYTVSLESSDELGIDWGLVYKSLSGNYGINLSNSFTNTSDAVSAGFSVLDTAKGKAGQFAGSDVILKALSEQAKVTNVKTNNIMTTNMAAVPVSVANQTTYLQSVSTSQTSNVGSTSSLNPGSVTTGTNITIMPKVSDDNSRIMLTMVMDISSLKQIRQIVSPDNTNKVEAPNIDSNSINQRVWLKPNETLVISGFDQEEKNGTKQGIGDPNNIFFGGGMKGGNKKTTSVITITPFVQ